MKQKQSIILLIIFSFFTSQLISQNFVSPINFTPSLSANFGELRNNHFHSGIDYRTQQVENKPIFSIDEGFVSRINISPTGYGLALYIDHPSGHTSVYGHLNSFSQKITNYIRQKQYEKETYRIDYYLQPGEITVKKGEQIALSGNTGGSGGPHLHFEIRDTKTQDPLDVLNFLGRTVNDKASPDVRMIAVYPQEGKGVVNGSSAPLRQNIGRTKSGTYAAPARAINAWGKIGLGIKSYDRIQGTSNIYGVEKVILTVDGKTVFTSDINRLSFDKTRMINSFMDFEDWRNSRSMIMKSFVEPGNKLDFITAINDGFIEINAEKNYNVRYELTDHYGNRTVYSFIIKGVKQNIPQPTKCENFMTYLLSNSFVDADFSLTIPLGNLYTDICYKHSKTASPKYFSPIHRVNNKPVPLHRNGQIWLKQTKSADVDSTKFGIIKIDKNGKESWIGGTYKNGGLEANINELGDRFAIDVDTIAPTITPVIPSNWLARKRIVVQLKDNKSGISSFRGEINGKFILMSHDTKSTSYTYIFDDSRLVKGENQKFTFTATDGAGNKSDYSYEFLY